MHLNAPNLITLLRIMLIPLVVGVFYLPDAWLPNHWKNVTACALFAVIPRI